MESARVCDHVELSGGYRRLELVVPAIADAVQPGQFVHLRIPGTDGFTLRRPFSVFNAAQGRLHILYKAVGRGTRVLTRLVPGNEVSLLGPLGKGFPLDVENRTPVLVAGGYGVAPLYFLASRLPVKGRLFVGGASRDDILCLSEFEQIGWKLFTGTEDGSLGMQGLVTDVLDAWLEKRANDPAEPVFYACGPDGMLRAVGERAEAGGWPAWLSLDKHMGCGVGACLACVQKVRAPDGAVRWARVCKDGPVFEAREIVWNA